MPTFDPRSIDWQDIAWLEDSAAGQRGHCRLTATPRGSRSGRSFTTRGPSASGPVRSLGPGRSIETWQGRPTLGGRLAHMLGHTFPYTGVVVGAVYTGNVHSFGDEVADQQIVVGRLGGKSHHDPGHPPDWTGTEEGVGIVIEGRAARLEALDSGTEAGRRAIDRGADTLDGGQHVSLAPTQRGKTTGTQPTLQITYVALPEGQVVDQVDCVGLMDRGYRGDGVGMGAFPICRMSFPSRPVLGGWPAIQSLVASLPVVIGVTVRLSGVLSKGQRMVVLVGAFDGRNLTWRFVK